MAELRTLARPYAEAVFRIADAGAKLDDWFQALSDLAHVALDTSIAAAIDDPNIPSGKVAELFLQVLAGRLSVEAENFVRVLAENQRLDLLPEISAQFEVLKNDRQGVLQAQVTSAFPLSDAQLAELTAELQKKTGKRIKAEVIVDPELIAGVCIAIGDKVIDGSARAQLNALEAALKH